MPQGLILFLICYSFPKVMRHDQWVLSSEKPHALLSVLSFMTETNPGTWRRAGDRDCMIYEDASKVEAMQELDLGLSLFLEFQSEPASERDQACPALWLQGFRLLLKSLGSGTLSQAWAEWLFSHQWCNPTTALFKPAAATRHCGQPHYLSASQSRSRGITRLSSLLAPEAFW